MILDFWSLPWCEFWKLTPRPGDYSLRDVYHCRSKLKRNKQFLISDVIYSTWLVGPSLLALQGFCVFFWAPILFAAVGAPSVLQVRSPC